MAISHVIRSRNGKEVTVQTHPRRAMTLHCLECLGWRLKELSDCGGEKCSLFAYNRYDKSGRTGLLPKLTPLKTIRRECLKCSGTGAGVKDCHSPLCNLFLFRFGRNPGLAGRDDPRRFDKMASVRAFKPQKTTQTPSPYPNHG